MTLSRRQLMKLAAASFIFFKCQRVFSSEFTELGSSVLPSFLDTLIPADQSPAASTLRVDEILLRRIGKDQAYVKLIEYGCLWLEQQSQKDFQKSWWQISEQQRELIVATLVAKHPSSNPHQFFSRVSRDAFQIYYSDPRSWQGMGISRPPQPQGYAAYDRAPQ